MQLTTARHFEDRVVAGVLHPQRHVGLQFAVQAVAQLAAGDELAFAAGQRRGVDAEVHGQRRLVHLQHRQRVLGVRRTHGATDAQLFDTVDQHDVAGFGFLHDLALQAAELQHLVDAALDRRAVRAELDHHVLQRTHAAARDAAHADLADVARVVERNDLQLERAVRIVVTLRHLVEDGLEQRLHIAFAHIVGQTGVAVQARGVHHREVELIIVGAQLIEQVEGLVDDPLRTCARAVHLVDHNDGLQAQGQRLARHETRLRHRAFHGVHQQQHAVDHRQHALHLAAEVRVTRGVDDVDVRAVVLDRAVLGQDGDTALFFDVVRVHHALGDLLVLAERAGLAEELVDQRGLAVVNVGNDGDVAKRAHGYELGNDVTRAKNGGRKGGSRNNPTF